MNKLHLILTVATALIISTSASASSVTVPYSFTYYQTSIANQLNTNFSALRYGINDNDTRLDWIDPTVRSNSSRISTNSSRTYYNEQHINALEVTVGNNVQNITTVENTANTNASRISAMETSLTEHNDDVTGFENSIDNHEQRIAILESSTGTSQSSQSVFVSSGSVEFGGSSYPMYGMTFELKRENSDPSATETFQYQKQATAIYKMELLLNPGGEVSRIYALPMGAETLDSLTVNMMEATTGKQVHFVFNSVAIKNIKPVPPRQPKQPNLLKLSISAIDFSIQSHDYNVYQDFHADPYYRFKVSSGGEGCYISTFSAYYMAPSIVPGPGSFSITDFTLDLDAMDGDLQYSSLNLSGTFTENTLCMFSSLVQQARIDELQVHVFDGATNVMNYYLRTVIPENYLLTVNSNGKINQSLSFDVRGASVTVQ